MPTIKQKLALDKIVENGGNVSKAMRDVGYSVETAKEPGKLTNSKGFQELVEKHLPDSLLTKVHKEGLGAYKFESQLTGRGESEIVKVPDFAVRHRYLDTGYKIKRHYPTENSPNNNILIVVSGESASRYGKVTDANGTNSPN